MNLNHNVKAMKVGDLVRSDFDVDSKAVVRRITRIERDKRCGSGYRVWADAGECCEACKRPFAKSIDGIDGAWFLPLETRHDSS